MICWILLLLGLVACTPSPPSALVTIKQAMPPDQTQVSKDVDAIRAGIAQAHSPVRDELQTVTPPR